MTTERDITVNALSRAADRLCDVLDARRAECDDLRERLIARDETIEALRAANAELRADNTWLKRTLTAARRDQWTEKFLGIGGTV